MVLDKELYVDTTLPFGLRSVLMIFSAVADALAFIIRNKKSTRAWPLLDDFSLIGPPQSPACLKWLDTSLQVYEEEVGFSVAPKKTEGPATRINLFGIEIHSAHMELRLPRKKLETVVKPVVQNTYKPCRSRKCIRGHIPMHAIFAVFIYIFIPVLSRSYFTSRTPDKDQKIEQLFYYILVQVL